LAYSSILKREVKCSSDTLDDFYGLHGVISQDKTLYDHRCKNLKSHAFVSVSPYCIRSSEGVNATRYLPPPPPYAGLIGKIKLEKRRKHKN
jgi:hypothetical protein